MFTSFSFCFYIFMYSFEFIYDKKSSWDFNFFLNLKILVLFIINNITWLIIFKSYDIIKWFVKIKLYIFSIQSKKNY